LSGWCFDRVIIVSPVTIGNEKSGAGAPTDGAVRNIFALVDSH
jgi:hypothetical protein